jgi:antitoxin VapB
MDILMKTTVFFSGGSQAIRIPKEFRFGTKQVEIERKGATLVLRPIAEENVWPAGYLESFAEGRVDEDFVRPPQGETREIHL